MYEWQQQKKESRDIIERDFSILQMNEKEGKKCACIKCKKQVWSLWM